MRYPEITSKEALDSRLSTFSDKDYAFAFGDFSDWYYLDGTIEEPEFLNIFCSLK